MRPTPRDSSFKRFLKAAPMAVILAASASAADAKRLALVVGNSEYDAVYSLKNAARDAQDVASQLKRLGFEVTLLTDTGDAAFRTELDAFATRAEADDVESTLFYFSGHAFQLDGVNYLVPKDAVLSSAEVIKSATWRLDEIVSRLEDRDRSTLIFLDACRNNPLPENARGNSGEGLAKLQTGSGTFVAFATQPNNVTADGAGDNSPFTEALIDHLGTEGISISDLMIRVRNEVEDATFGRQTPWDQSSLRAQFYFKPQNEKAALSQADYEMLAALDPETRNRLLSLMGAERIDFDEDKVDDMEVAIQVASLTNDMPVAQPGTDDSAEEGGFVITGIGDDQLTEIVKAQKAARDNGDDGGFVITAIPTAAPVDAAPDADTAAPETLVAEADPATTTLPAQAADQPILTAELVPGADTGPSDEVDENGLSELLLASLSPARAVEVFSAPNHLQGQEPDDADLQIVGVSAPSWPKLEGRDLAKAVQTELSRLGCYRMVVDGAFGRGSKLSLVRYYGNKGVAAETLEPTNGLLQVLRAEPSVVCQNTTEIEDRRVAAISTRVSAVRKEVSAPAAVVVQKQRLSTGTTRVNSAGQEVTTTRIRPGGFR
jgi:uncharacterized caspase-like protein